MSLDALRAAGRIAAEARREGESLIVAGAAVRDVCEAVERAIERRGGGLAFPVQSSRNSIAAHYCPSPEDETLYEDGDLAKLDVGVHVDGVGEVVEGVERQAEPEILHDLPRPVQRGIDALDRLQGEVRPDA